MKVANAYIGWFANLADGLSKVLADIKAPEKEEDTWEMKCSYKYDRYWFIYSEGDVDSVYWGDNEVDEGRLKNGNVFPTKETAELESKRRKLLTRFRAFRDECNGDWKPNFGDDKEKYYLFYSTMEDCIKVGWIVLGCSFNNFGYFKNKTDAERAIELFGKEIIELFVECEVGK